MGPTTTIATAQDSPTRDQKTPSHVVTGLRHPSVDALRGLVMIIMALDHTRDFFHAASMVFPPEDLSRTTTALFLTRWVTHICAPVFSFTAGLGAFFWMSHGRTPAQLSRFLWTRGLWLAILDITVMRFALTFSMTEGIVILNVLWVLGLSMIVLALLVHIPIRLLAPMSLVVIALHDLFDPITPSRFGSFAWLWEILHQQGLFKVGGVTALVAYPLIPWFAVMALGFCFGKVMLRDPDVRRRTMIWMGYGMVVAFLVLRGINKYGDPEPWTTQFPHMTVLSFLRCRKYPPSLDFLLMTMGPALLILAWFERINFSRKNPLIIFGRVPLFFFVVHFYVAHLLTFPFALVRYERAAFLLKPLPSIGGSAELYPPNYGYSLPMTYVAWAIVVLLLYPMCLWFSRLKEHKKSWWLGYL